MSEQQLRKSGKGALTTQARGQDRMDGVDYQAEKQNQRRTEADTLCVGNGLSKVLQFTISLFQLMLQHS